MTRVPLLIGQCPSLAGVSGRFGVRLIVGVASVISAAAIIGHADARETLMPAVVGVGLVLWGLRSPRP